MSFYFYFFLFLIICSKIYSLNVHQIIASSITNCKIKFVDQDWLDVDNCDKTSFEEIIPGDSRETNNLYIDYKLGDKLDVTLKFYDRVPPKPEHYCSAYLMIKVNEYFMNNDYDYIYYCTNCGCTESIGDKTYCHKWGDKRLYCQPAAGKDYNFFIRINGLYELDLMNAYTSIRDYYKFNGDHYYLEDDQENMPLKFSSNSVLFVNYDSRHKVNLDELLIKYSFQGEGEFYTNDNKKLNSSGYIGEDIYFKKSLNLSDSSIHQMNLTVQTVSKFGCEKYNSTSDIAEFFFHYCSNGYKIYNNISCYKCYFSCFNCSDPDDENNHYCYECNKDYPYYYITENNKTKNCYSSCKEASKIQKEIDSKICIDIEECQKYISSNNETCVDDCSKISEYFYYINGKFSKNCINYCNEWISEDNTTCTNNCSYINQLSNYASHKCVTQCPSNLFYNPELMICDEKCWEPYIYYINYKNNTKKCVKKCDEIPYIVEDEDNKECLTFKKFEIISIELNTLIYPEKSESSKFLINYENIDNYKMKVNFNQKIGKRITLIDREYEIIPEEKNSIIINIGTLKEKQNFTFKDSLDNSYDFGFEIELTKKKDKDLSLNIVFITVTIILLAVIVLLIILYCKLKHQKNSINFNYHKVNEFFG